LISIKTSALALVFFYPFRKWGDVQLFAPLHRTQELELLFTQTYNGMVDLVCQRRSVPSPAL